MKCRTSAAKQEHTSRPLFPTSEAQNTSRYLPLLTKSRQIQTKLCHIWTHMDPQMDPHRPTLGPTGTSNTAMVQTLYSLWSRPYIALHSICIATARHWHSIAQLQHSIA